MIARRHRHQTGTVWLKSGSWYLVRFYTNVRGERKQVARFLVLGVTRSTIRKRASR